MSRDFEESGWSFSFSEAEWSAVIKWDDDPTYTKSLQVLRGETRRTVKGCGRQNCRWSGGSTEQFISEGTRAADFAAVGPNSRPFLIEVKNVRGDGAIEGMDERAFKIAAKVRDSLCGIPYAKAQTGDIPAADLTAVRARFKRSSNVRVVVVFEHAGSPTQTLALRKRLAPLLRWMRGELAVVEPAGVLIPGLTITPI